MSLISNFTAEYDALKKAQEPTFDPSLKGVVESVKQTVCSDEYHPSAALIERFSVLSLRAVEPMKIAIVGQFSSGKSTFLNALLGRQILPTGITPVTSKVNYIKYGDDFLLEVTHLDGQKEYHAIESIKRFTDQRENTESIAYLTLYAPIELLREITFVDTPGLNSQGENDTETTMEVLTQVDGIIWLMLIDNAGRESERKMLDQLRGEFGQKSLCVLNQKDKFSSQKLIDETVQYVKSAFGGLFADVIAISAKKAVESKDKQSYDDSNIQSVLDFVETTLRPSSTTSKEFFVKKELSRINESLIRQHETFKQAYAGLESIVLQFETAISSLNTQCKERYVRELKLLFKDIEALVSLIANELYSQIKPSKKIRYTTTKTGLFNKESIVAVEYETVKLDSDAVRQKLFFEDEKIDKLVKIIINKLTKLKEASMSAVKETIGNYEASVKEWQTPYERIRKQELSMSDRAFAELRHFASNVFESCVQEYIRAGCEFEIKIESEMGLLCGALSMGYKNAVEATMAHFDKRILAAVENHEKDPQRFALYQADMDDVRRFLEESLSLYHYENRMNSSQTLLDKSIAQFLTNAWAASSRTHELLQQKQTACTEKIAQLQKLTESIRETPKP